MKKLEELKKGDRINIEFGGVTAKAKVLNNDPENKRIYLAVKLTPMDWLIGYNNIVVDYDSHNFYNFNLINNA